MKRAIFCLLMGTSLLTWLTPQTQAAIDFALTSTNQFGTVDLQTGVFTPTGILGSIIGSYSGDINRLPGGPLYGMTNSSNLILINPNTLAESVVGDSGNGIFGLAFRSDGTLFGAGYQNLYQINTSTGAASLVGHMGDFPASGFFGLRFDGVGNLFLETQNGSSTSSLYSVNTSTGAATLVGATGYQYGAIDFENGTLYGFTADSKIISIDTTTGAGTFLFNETGGTGPIYEATTAAGTPEPSTFVIWGLLGAAGLFMARRRRKAA